MLAWTRQRALPAPALLAMIVIASAATQSRPGSGAQRRRQGDANDRKHSGYRHRAWRDGALHLPTRARRAVPAGAAADGRARNPPRVARHGAPALHSWLLRAA